MELVIEGTNHQEQVSVLKVKAGMPDKQSASLHAFTTRAADHIVCVGQASKISCRAWQRRHDGRTCCVLDSQSMSLIYS